MKKVMMLFLLVLMFLNFSCKNEEWEFPDFDYKAVYFPYQYPVRTLILGDYIYDNENDNNLRFDITARVGGMYENKTEWKVKYRVADELVNGLLSDKGDTIRILPPNYYTLNPTGELIIPKGKFDGRIEVQLKEEFLDDPLAVGTNYIIPLVITESTADSVLRGLADQGIENPDPRVASDWIFTPKDFTLFAIKFVNNYHGKYLRRGKSIIKDMGGNGIDTVVYRNKYVEKDEVCFLQTVSKNGVSLVNDKLKSNKQISGNYSIKISFDDENECTIANTEDSELSVSGTGNFVKDGDEWGNKKRDVIYLNYMVNNGSYIHSITDTLVFRDKAVVFEEFKPLVLN